ncbi:MAG: TonB-dependent receptor [Methylococcales bacterium]|nr:TonB-dependent receptor [Methylococcales bacterium]
MPTKKYRLLIAPLLAFNVYSQATPAAEKKSAANKAEETIVLPAMDVVATPESPIEALSGSGTFLNQETLFKSHVFTVNEALRKIPGVSVRDEDGLGLRPNISIRGINPFRSTKILFLEDGIPLNFAPYGDNDIYFHPPVERYDGIEVIKGADLTQFGPQTISGAINYITPTPPQKPGGFASFTGGNRDYLNGHVRYGGTADKVNVVDSVGGVMDYLHKEGSGSRDNTFAKIDDINLKGIIDINARNSLTLRGDFFQQQEQGSFGVTEAEYRNFGARYNPFKNDQFTTSRWSTSATHEFRFNNAVTLATNFYWSKFDRDWWRQMNQQPTDTQCGTAFRDARLNGQAVNVDSCNFTRGRLRSYETWGIAPTLHAEHKLFGLSNQLDAGFRAHFESQYRKTEDGSSPTARTGILTENNNRFADAYSGFVQNRFNWGDWSMTPGVRVESISYQRQNLLPGQQATGQSNILEALPSFALNYDPIKEASLFFGVHRGFAPPRVEDSVYNTGNPVEIGAELSWNYEVGVRGRPVSGIKTDLTFFHNDFQNLTVFGTVGGNDTPVAQGQALFQGIEFMSRIDTAELFNWTHNPYLQIAYTWLPTAETTTAFHCLPLANGSMSASCPGGLVYGSKAGNRSPYAPEHLLTTTVGYSHPNGFDFHAETVFVAEQYSDFMNLQSGADYTGPTGTSAANNTISALSGQYGKIPDYAIVNLASTYQVYKGLDLFVSVKNVFDKQYIVDRVRGIMPGSPRLIQAGFKYEF